MKIKHDKEKVLNTGLELFCRKGYNSLGVDEICKTTGMTKGAFYNAFKSKENFLLSAVKIYGEFTVDYLINKLKAENVKAIDLIKNMYVGMLKMQPDNSYTGCMINNIMSELGLTSETISIATAHEFDNLINVIEPIVKKAQQEGDLNPNIDSRLLTELFHATFYGTLTRLKSTKDFQKGISTMNLLIDSFKGR